MLAKWIGEQPTGTAQLVLDSPLRFAELPSKLALPDPGQMRVADGVRADQHVGLEATQFVPGHRAQPREIIGVVGFELRNQQRRASSVGETGTDEDGDRHAEVAERREDGRDAPEGVVEGDGYAGEAPDGSDLTQE